MRKKDEENMRKNMRKKYEENMRTNMSKNEEKIEEKEYQEY